MIQWWQGHAQFKCNVVEKLNGKVLILSPVFYLQCTYWLFYSIANLNSTLSLLFSFRHLCDTYASHFRTNKIVYWNNYAVYCSIVIFTSLWLFGSFCVWCNYSQWFLTIESIPIYWLNSLMTLCGRNCIGGGSPRSTSEWARFICGLVS